MGLNRQMTRPQHTKGPRGFRIPRSRLFGFTLVEVLVVIGIVALLAALLFPVFSQGRRSAKQNTCASNLRQLGLAVALYMQESDGLYPLALDAVDKADLASWSAWPEWQEEIVGLPLLNSLLRPHVKDDKVFACPLDGGTNILDDSRGGRLLASPSLFAHTGFSYKYRTLLALERMSESQLKMPANVDLLHDVTGAWHGVGRAVTEGDLDEEAKLRTVERDFRYNTLFTDQHVKLLTFDQYQAVASSAP